MGAPRELWEALEADLLRVGFTLDDLPKRLGLRAVLRFMEHAPRGTAVHRLALEKRSEWGHVEELLARVIETLQDANWQRQGNKFAPKPKRLLRPWEGKADGGQHFGDAEGYTVAEFNQRWAERSAA